MGEKMNPVEDWLPWALTVAAFAWSLAFVAVLRYWPRTRIRPRLHLRLALLDFFLLALLYLVLLSVSQWIAYRWIGPVGGAVVFRAEQVYDWKDICAALANDERRAGPRERIWRVLTAEQQMLIRQSANTKDWSRDTRTKVIALFESLLLRKDVFLEDDSEPTDAPQAEDGAPVQDALHNRFAFQKMFPEQTADRIRILRVMCAMALANTLMFVTIPLMTRTLLNKPIYTLGIHRSRLWSCLGFGIAQLLVWWPLAAVTNWWTRALMGQSAIHPAERFLTGEHSFPEWSLIIYSVVFAAPFAEELIFRGLLQSWLSRRIGAYGAIAVTAGCFALMHASTWPDPIPLLVLATGLGLTYQRTGSLWAPITLHAAFNASMLAVGYFESMGFCAW